MSKQSNTSNNINENMNNSYNNNYNNYNNEKNDNNGENECNKGSFYDPEKKTDLAVTVIGANDLPPMDHHGTSCDPYVIVCVGKDCQETKPIKKNINPQWNRLFHFKLSSGSTEEITFKLKDKNTLLPNVYLGEGTVNINEVMGEQNSWEGKVALHGKYINGHSTLSVKIERKNRSSGLKGFVERASVKGYEKTSNIANLAFITAHNHMSSRKLTGLIEVEVKLGVVVVVIQAEVEQQQSHEVGHVEVVEDSEANNQPDQPKPTNAIHKMLDTSISQALDNMQTSKVKLTREVCLGLKAGVELDLDMIPMLKASVKVLMGVKMKATIGKEKLVAKPGGTNEQKATIPEINKLKEEQEETKQKKENHPRLNEATARFSSEWTSGKDSLRDLVHTATGKALQ